MLLNRDTVQWKKRREEKNGELLLKALKMTVWQCSIHSQILRSFSKKKKKKQKLEQSKCSARIGQKYCTTQAPRTFCISVNILCPEFYCLVLM